MSKNTYIKKYVIFREYDDRYAFASVHPIGGFSPVENVHKAKYFEAEGEAVKWFEKNKRYKDVGYRVVILRVEIEKL